MAFSEIGSVYIMQRLKALCQDSKVKSEARRALLVVPELKVLLQSLGSTEGGQGPFFFVVFEKCLFSLN